MLYFKQTKVFGVCPLIGSDSVGAPECIFNCKGEAEDYKNFLNLREESHYPYIVYKLDYAEVSNDDLELKEGQWRFVKVSANDGWKLATVFYDKKESVFYCDLCGVDGDIPVDKLYAIKS